MGFLRLVLAAAVVCGHSTPILGLPILDVGLAVHAFFVISGFYMALILSSKYERKQRSLWLFYSNRFLRIYPMYYVTLLFAFSIYALAALKTGKPVDRLEYWMQAAHLNLWLPLILLALAQILIIGIEASSLFDFDAGKGFVLIGSVPGAVPGFRFSFLPQAWTIGVELLFYLTAPFLIHLSKRILWSIVALNILAVFLMNHFWPTALSAMLVSHFFPFEIGYFILGILAYRLFYKRAIPGIGTIGFNWLVIAAIAIASLTLGLFKDSALADVGRMSYVALLFLCISFLFNQTKGWAIDRLLGELSYPIYLTHIPLKWLIAAVAGSTQRGLHEVSGNVLFPVTIAFSALMVFFVDYPIDRWRQRRVAKSSTAPSAYSN